MQAPKSMSNQQRQDDVQLKNLPNAILQVLKKDGKKSRIEDLRASLPSFRDLPDGNWFAVINDLLTDGMINAHVVRSGLYNAIGAAFNIEITSRGAALTPELLTPAPSKPMKEGDQFKLVTRKGECFEITFQRKDVAQNRDGVFHLFLLKDLTKNRGDRLVSVYRFGPKDFYGPDYDERIDTVLLNAIRRAFDSGMLAFDLPYYEHMYKEIPLRTEDFRSQPLANGEEIQQLIKHEAYWLAFRNSEKIGASYFFRFDSAADLDYLGASAADVCRYVWLLGQRGLLHDVTGGLGKPTEKLVDIYESEMNSKQGRSPMISTDQWDVFISHASEDKDEIARPLADALRSHGLRVWYDEFSLTVGDSLRKRIDCGLANSRFGIVILSRHFFEKHWPEQELNGLATRELNGRKVILPIWHGVGFQEVSQYSPMLADRLAVSTTVSLNKLVQQLLQAINSTVTG